MHQDRINKEYRFLNLVERKRSVLYVEVDLDDLFKSASTKKQRRPISDEDGVIGDIE